MNDAPLFKTRGPLDPDQDKAVYVRRPELRKVLLYTQQVTMSTYVAVLGARQTGKTTLLAHLRKEVAKYGYAVAMVDLALLRHQPAEECYRRVSQVVLEALEPLLPEGKAWAPVGKSVDFCVLLRQLAEVVQVPRILILLDEVGALTPEASDSFFNTVRTIFSSGLGADPLLRKYQFVLAGAVDLYQLTYGMNSPLNICEKVYLGDLSLPAVRKLVGAFEQIGVEVAPEVPAAIYEWMHGHPYLTQRVCALLEQSGEKRLDPKMVEGAVEVLLQDDDNLRHVVRALDRHAEAQALMAEILAGRRVTFSRNNPLVAHLEMVGVIRAVRGVCRVRNELYRRLLERQFGADQGGDLRPDEAMALSDVRVPRRYEDFEVWIPVRSNVQRTYRVITRSFAGETEHLLRLNPKSQPWSSALRRLDEGDVDGDLLRQVGMWLWEAVFEEDVRVRFAACQAQLQAHEGVRLRLRIDPPELAGLPWELMYDPRDEVFLALSPRTPLVRYIALPQELPSLEFVPPLRVLLVSANPSGLPALDIDGELRRVQEALAPLKQAGRVAVSVLNHATVASLQDALRQPYHVFHYIGHGLLDRGNGKGALALEQEDGRLAPLSPDQVYYLLRDTSVRLAVLNACWTARGLAQALIVAGMPAALAMQYEMPDASAVIFAREFYRALADGWPMEACVTEGRKAVMFAVGLEEMDWGIPVLYMRSPHGELLRRRGGPVF